MRSRLLAAAVLIGTGVLAWLAVSYTLAARLLQALIGISILYVAYLAWVGWRTIRRALREAGAAGASAQDPTAARAWVSVVVPARNEASVVGGVVADLAAQDYARRAAPCYDVLVVDDGSSDATADVARQAGARLGDRLRILRREPGSGPRTKGAVLAFAHAHLHGEVVAVLDADSRLPADYLARAMAAWRRDPTAAAVQTRRRQLNADAGWLPGAQDEEHLMDIASQCGRWATDGTAELRGTGMFVRREVLEAVGGWDASSITEDLELSTRLAAAGERIAMAPEAVVSEEAVEDLRALWRQRMRWAEGSVRRLMQHGPGLLADARLPLGRRLDFVVFLTEFVVPPLFVASIAAGLLTALLPTPADWTVPATLFVGYGLGTFLLAAAGLAAYGTSGLPLLGRAARGAVFLSHWLVVVPIALLRVALAAPSAEFAQTPRVGRRDR